MKKNTTSGLHTLTPLPAGERLYIGIDVGKTKHVASFVSRSLALPNTDPPVRAYANSRSGFEALEADVRVLAPLEQVAVVLEKTGHYHRALVEFLFSLSLSIHVIHVRIRPAGQSKTDVLDARRMAVKLYNRLEVETISEDAGYRIHQLAPETEIGALLQALTRRHYEIGQRRAALKNQLVAINDELFPELAKITKAPSSSTIRAFQKQFPLPKLLEGVDPAVLLYRPGQRRLSEADFTELQASAARSIGTRNVGRQQGLQLEQIQILAELDLLDLHKVAIRVAIEERLLSSRDGQILTSVPGIGPLLAGTILGAIGNIDNFNRVGQLKSFLGWGVQEISSGDSLKYTRQTPGGHQGSKRLFYLAEAWS